MNETEQGEEWLKAGIGAYKWLSRSEEAARAADAEGIADLTPEAEKAIHALYSRWQSQWKGAKDWIESLRRKGVQLPSFDQYEECGSLVTDWLEHHELYQLGQKCLAEQFEE